MTEFGNKWLIDEAKKQFPGYDYYIPMMDNGRSVVMANKWDDHLGDCSKPNLGTQVDAMEIFQKAFKK